MGHYLLTIYQDPALPPVESSAEDCAETVRRIAEFNQKLRENGQLLYAGQLDAPDTAAYTSAGGQLGDGLLHPVSAPVHGLWIIDVPTRTQAQALAVRAANACGQPVALRPMRAN
ncbi:MAG TPA: hypothetical protein VFC72_05440 [Corynebacterium sp.]|nr:hypothetical protein [Corynebacterium sp.]